MHSNQKKKYINSKLTQRRQEKENKRQENKQKAENKIAH